MWVIVFTYTDEPPSVIGLFSNWDEAMRYVKAEVPIHNATVDICRLMPPLFREQP
jgi:hypothetical protein